MAAMGALGHMLAGRLETRAANYSIMHPSFRSSHSRLQHFPSISPCEAIKRYRSNRSLPTNTICADTFTPNLPIARLRAPHQQIRARSHPGDRRCLPCTDACRGPPNRISPSRGHEDMSLQDHGDCALWHKARKSKQVMVSTHSPGNWVIGRRLQDGRKFAASASLEILTALKIWHLSHMGTMSMGDRRPGLPAHITRGSSSAAPCRAVTLQPCQ
ncbi:uncharacterized protein F5Z01DRAFT_135297 [Emericellopsis atlantica]|uniref:Uncharacterized protein n=1 Tax=Emericellopsis atlantica TaxID=2614577 RepID=A0A9P8CNV8_9HYPO|nr:uncharacterized protein F5Z01DRAFT_135297 [Emericellopsis atlantica]KAG9253903.1 hypothetical protein F5Z01DRAFT_135297 [Emericellopsis atlantica]